MILSDRQINEKIEKGELLVSDDGEVLTNNNSISPKSRLSNISYDLTTKGFISKENETIKEKFKLEPLDSVFVESLEKIKLPADICAEVKLKCGSMTDGLLFDAPIYQPGHNGSNIFYRLTNISNKAIELTNKKEYAYVFFYQTAEVEEPYKGKYNKSETITKEIREHSYTSVYPDIKGEIDQIEEKAAETRTKFDNAEKSIYGNVLVIITIFITLYTLLSSFIQALAGNNLLAQFSTVLLILGSIFSLVGAVCVVIENEKTIYKKVIALWLAAFVFFAWSFCISNCVGSSDNGVGDKSASQEQPSSEQPTEETNEAVND